MPKYMRLYKDKEKAKQKRYKDRKSNYERGKFGNRWKEKNYFNIFEKFLIINHIISDRRLAKWLRSSTNGIQAMRWRVKVNYLGLY